MSWFPSVIGTYQRLDNMNHAVGSASEPAPQRQTAKHEWLRERLEQDMAGMQPRTALPTERELATRYEVSRATVRHALDALERSGAVYRVQGAGTFVAAPHVSKSLSLTSFSEDMRMRGLRPSSLVLTADEVPADSAIAGDLQIPVAEPVVRLVRVRTADDSPMCLETVYLPAARVPGLLASDLTASLYELLERLYGLRLGSASQKLEAVTVIEADAGLLGVPPGAAALRVHRVSFDERDQPVECTTSLYRADRYDIQFAVRREGQ
jgi:GntR family transcriptional regulator